MSEHRDTLEVVERLGRVVGPLGITNLASMLMLALLYARADAMVLEHHIQFWIQLWGVTAIGWPIFHFGFNEPMRKIVADLERTVGEIKARVEASTKPPPPAGG